MSKDIDYLYASARVRCLELGLLNQDRIERMLFAKSTDEALKILSECGYGDVRLNSLADLDFVISAQREKAYELFERISLDKEMTDIFRIKYDYHNIKVIIKSFDNKYDYLYIPFGRFDTSELETIIRESDYYKLNPVMNKAVFDAKEILARTSNPQFSDFILDRASFEEMKSAAEKTKSDFIINYVKLLIDINNLRAFVRCRNMKNSSDLLTHSVFEGGNIDTTNLFKSIDDTSIKVENIYAMTTLEDAAKLGDDALINGKSLTAFEKNCDDTVVEYLKKAKYVSFGIEPIFSYFAAKEAEFSAVRTIISGKFSDVSVDIIRERLRVAYV